MRYLVAYDIADDARRNRVHDLLLDRGYPLQESVFVVDCDSFAELWETLTPRVDVVSDRVLAAPLCGRCREEVRTCGDHLSPLPTAGLLVVASGEPTSVPFTDPNDYSLFAQVTAHASLWRAWRRVHANRGGAGLDGVTVKDFAATALEGVTRLRHELAAGSYSPARMRRRRFRKPSGGWRELRIPTVRDRIVQTALARLLSPLWELEFSPASHAYRPGRSVATAIARVIASRDAGRTVVVRADVDDFFDEIDRRRLEAFLAEHVPDARLLALIGDWLSTIPGVRGVPQGSPLAPLLSNLYLDAFDDGMLCEGLALTRYADELIVCCRTVTEAQTVAARMVDMLDGLGLRLNAAPVITSFDEGFDFLGKTFCGSLVLPGPAARARHRARWRLGQ